MAKDPRKLIKIPDPAPRREKRQEPLGARGPEFAENFSRGINSVPEEPSMEEQLVESRGPEYYREKTRQVEEEMPHIQKQVEFIDAIIDALMTPPRAAMEGIKGAGSSLMDLLRK